MIEEETEFSEFKRDRVSPNEESTIILGINGHGMDLCRTRLPEGKTLVFSMANKGCVHMDEPKKNVVKITHLANELNHEKKNIFEVFDEFEKKCENDTDLDFNLYNKSTHDRLRTRDESFIQSMNLMLEIEEDNKNKLFEEHPEKEDRKKIAEEYLKNKQKYETEKEEYMKKKQYTINFIESCDKKYVAKPRNLMNDRFYDIKNDSSSQGLFNIYILDVRRPKSAHQNNIEDIYRRLNAKREVNLSELLHICYDEFHFDYVSIVDFACRCNDDGTCNVDCPSSIAELQEGRKLMAKYKDRGLGKKKSKRKNKKKKKQLTKIKNK
jgi:hypothetical protein